MAAGVSEWVAGFGVGEVSENNPLIASIATVDQAGIRVGMLPSPFCRTSFDNRVMLRTHFGGVLTLRGWVVKFIPQQTSRSGS